MKLKLRIVSLVASSLVALTLVGCGGLGTIPEPTTTQDALLASGLRGSTLVYITRGNTQEDMSKRARQVKDTVALVRDYIDKSGNIVVSLDAAATVVNERIMNSNLSLGDKKLAIGLVTEAIMLAGNQTIMPHPDIGVGNAQRLLVYLDQIDRVADVFSPAKA